MLRRRRFAVMGLVLSATLGCRAFGRGPSDAEVVAAVRASPPAPPTLGPTFLAQVDAVEVRERGPFNREGRYWPVRVRVKGAARIKITNAFQLGVADDRARAKTEAIEFVEEARFTKDDSGRWCPAYTYDSRGPQWRLGHRQTDEGR